MNVEGTHHDDQERGRPITMGPILRGSRKRHNNAPTMSARGGIRHDSQTFVRPDPIPAVPFALGLLFITGLIEGRVEGSIIGGIISCAVNRPIPRAASQPTFLTGSLASPFAISI